MLFEKPEYLENYSAEICEIKIILWRRKQPLIKMP
jgi:hypothetical protein